jgi:ATP-dependent DNA ligase
MLAGSTEGPYPREKCSYEAELDDYCAIASKNNGKAHLRSSNKNDFSHEYPAVASALGA